MKSTRLGITVLYCLAALTVAHLGRPSAAWAVPSFPGAEGHGGQTPGGRGGRVIEVTNLDDSGVGSLRAALTAAGPRIVVFRAGGTITLRDRIRITNPYLTIAAQTAPGEGIQLRGAGLSVATNDVIIRGLRVRPGDAPEGPSPEVRDGIEIWNRNVIVDHCSLSWGVDEVASTWFNTVSNVTYQWSIFSEGLSASTHPRGRHSKGLLIGDGAKRITIHHNVFAHNDERSPHQKGGTDAEILNNVVYNWGNVATHYATCFEDYDDRTAILSNVIGNVFRAGADSLAGRAAVFVNTSTCPIATDSKIFLKGNIGPGRAQDSGDQYALSNVPTAYRAEAPVATQSGVAVDPAATVFDRVLACAGALVPRRDAVDMRIAEEVRDRTGRIIDSQTQVGGWPVLAAGDPPLDSDRDGMPDDWERRHGLDPADPADGARQAASGYTWVEEYINGLFQGPCAPTTPPMGGTGGGSTVGGAAGATGAAGEAGQIGSGGAGGMAGAPTSAGGNGEVTTPSAGADGTLAGHGGESRELAPEPETGEGDEDDVRERQVSRGCGCRVGTRDDANAALLSGLPILLIFLGHRRALGAGRGCKSVAPRR